MGQTNQRPNNMCRLCSRKHTLNAEGRTIGFEDLPFRDSFMTVAANLEDDYEMFGLARPESELTSPSLLERLPTASPAFLQMYADTITKHNCHFETFGGDDLSSMEDPQNDVFDTVSSLNATAFGNMACMAMNSACADYRRRAMVQLTRMQTKFKSFLDTRNDLVFVDMKLEHDD